MEEAEAAAVELAVAANEQWRLAVAKADALSKEQWRLWVAKADAELAEASAAADEQRRLWVAKVDAEAAEAFAAADEQRRLWVAKAEAEFAEAAAKADTLAVEVVVAAMQQQRQQRQLRPVRSSGSGGSSGSSGRVAHKKAVYDREGYTMGCVLFTTLIVFFYVLNLLCAANIARITLGREEGIEGSSSTLIHDLNFLQIRHLNREGGLGLDKRAKPWVEVLSWEPRAFLYHNFLSLEETNYLRELYHSSPIEFKYSKANLPPPGQPYNPKFARRNSYLRGPLEFSGVYTASIERGQYKVIRDIEKRMADFMHIPPEHGEGLEMTIIRSGNTYYPHLDYFSNESDVRNGGGQRIATMIIFLNDVETGGEAIFPAAKGNFSSLPGRDQLSECGKEAGLAVKPKEGDAVFFWNVRPDGMPDPSSLHGHCLSSEESIIGVKRFRAHEHKI